MAKPLTPGQLLAQRPHTDLDGDDARDAQLSESEYAAGDLPEPGEYPDPDEDYDDEGDDDAVAARSDRDEQEESEGVGGERLEEAREQINNLLEDAEENDLKLTDYQRYWRRLQDMALHHVNRIWRAEGPGMDAAMRIGSYVQANQFAASHLTQLYAARHLDVNFTPFDPGPGITERPGVTKAQVYSRPLRERSLGAQLRRLNTLVTTDLQLSKVRTLFSAFDEDMSVNRAPIRTYRRVTESEKPCALCIIASDQVYFTTDLMPIHDNCECDVEMGDESDLDEHKARYHHIGFVQSLIDTGDQTKDITALADADAPIEDYHNLVKIENHGELGPVIVWSKQNFRGPRDLANPMRPRPIPTISGPGMGHEARLQRNASRVAQYRAQHFGPGGRPEPRYAPGAGRGSTHILPPITKTLEPKPKREVIDLDARRIAKAREAVESKKIDFDHQSVESILDDMAHKHIRQVGGFDDREWLNPRYNEAAVRRALQAMDECLDRYPNVSIDKFSITQLEDGVLAETGYRSLTDKRVASIELSDILMEVGGPAKDPRQFHYDSYKDDPIRYTVYHEFGHVVDHSSGRVARKKAPAAVMAAYRDSGRAIPFDSKMTAGEANRAILHNQDDSKIWMAEPGRLSGYSFVDGVKPGETNYEGKVGRAALNAPEAVAEAFADVEMRGEQASVPAHAIYRNLIDAYRHPKPLEPGEVSTAAIKEPAVEQLRKLTLPKTPWTDAQYIKEDNHSTNAAGHEILDDQQRALARQLAVEIYQKSAAIEPGITAAAKASTESNGGVMSGLDFKLKTGPSLYRKIQAEAIGLANGEPVDDNDLRQAAADIKDSVRYTAVMPEDGYWAKGNDLRKALESLGAKVIKDPVGIPLDGYRGRNMAFTLNGTPFEMQVHTELGVAIKDEAHKIYNESRVLKAADEAKGIDPKTDPAYVRMLDDMQAKWDSMPMLKGTPVVQTEKDAKSGDTNKVLYTMDRTEYQGRTVPGQRAALGSTEMLGRERVPTTRYGMNWLPDSPEAKIVAPARAIPDDLWDTLPVTHIAPRTPIEANEGTLKKKSIDKVVGGSEPFRANYVVKLYRSDDGKLHVVDGHTRIAMYNALDKDIPVRIMDDADLQRLTTESLRDAMPAPPPLPDTRMWPHLSDAEERAVKFYVGGDVEGNGVSYQVNGVLRKHPEWVKPDNEYGEQVANLDAALAKSSLDKRTTVRRIVTGQTRDIRAEVLAHMNDPNYRITDPGFVSTSRGSIGKLADKFKFYAESSGGRAAKPDISKAIVYEMDLPAGTHALDIGSALAKGDKGLQDLQWQNEVLLPRGLQWQIAGMRTDKATGIPIVKLRLASETVTKDEAPAVITGLSGDAKGWGSVEQRLPDGESAIKKIYSDKTDKAGNKTLDLRAMWDAIPDETLKENWRKALRQSAPWAQKAGADWYPGVNRVATNLSKKYGDDFEKRWGVKLTPQLVAAFIGAYSENNSWAGNLVGVRKFLDGSAAQFTGSLKDYDYDEARDYKGIKAGKYGDKYSVPDTGLTRKGGYKIRGQYGKWINYDFHQNKCYRAMLNPEGGLADLRSNADTAPKPADFAANIGGDYSKATADRWVARIMFHTDDADLAESLRSYKETKNKITTPVGYQRLSQALQAVAREPEFRDQGLNAAACQAIPWVHVVGPLGSIGEIDDLTDYASVKAETLRKAAEYGDVE